MSAEDRDHIDVDGRRVALSRPDKVLFPGAGVTKRDLALYHRRIAPLMLRDLADHPTTMERFPDGIDASGFIQQNAPDHFPDWIRTVRVTTGNGDVNHVVVDDAATLVYLADQACITLHRWASPVGALDHPDRMIIDLDPPDGANPTDLRTAARWVRELFDAVRLRTRIMTTGSSGFHVIAPLDAGAPYDAVREIARSACELLAARHPDALTVEQRISARGDRIYLDHLRNARGQTAVAPYSVRARPGAPVATPIGWDELGRVEPRSYTVANLFRRLGQRDDPWTDDGVEPQSLDGVADRLATLSG